MRVKFWGCRGSIPVPDSRMIRYGGNTSCVEIQSGATTLIIDAGTGIRKLGEDLKARNIHDINILVTHSHWDHIQGFPFFSPVYSPQTNITVFGCTNSYEHIRDILENQMSYEYFPVSFAELRSTISFTKICGSNYRIGDFSVSTIRTNHPVFTAGIRIENGENSFVFMTDNEIGLTNPLTPREAFVEFCRNAAYLVHDAQFTDSEYEHRKGWGHSTFEQVIALAKDAGARNVGFFHHDPNREDADLASLEQRYAAFCRDQGCGFKVFAVREMSEIEIK